MHSKGELQSYYAENFMLMTDYKYSLGDLENMIYFERTIYLSFIHKKIQEKAELINTAQQQ